MTTTTTTKNSSVESALKSKKIVGTSFGTDKDGQTVELFTLTNRDGTIVKLITYGATLTEWWVPDKTGTPVNINLGFATLKQYEQSNALLGATAGRYANRIADAKFTLDGKEYKLPANHGRHCLHGGIQAFHKRIWQATPSASSDSQSVKFSYLSKDMEEGFPGNLKTEVTYTLTEENELKIEYVATTDKPTPINLTNHSYFNLAGAGNGTVLDHIMQINADSYTPSDKDLIPTGKIAGVANTPFDFTKPKVIGERIDEAGGYDLNYVLHSQNGKPTQAAIVQSPISGLEMQAFTTEPGIHFYAGMNLNEEHAYGGSYGKHAGFCLEAQHYPNSINTPNNPDFPNTVLRPGETYKQTTIYKISKIRPL